MSAPIHAVTMPKWGIEMTEGTIVQWTVALGETVEKGSPLLEVETEKIVNSVDSPASGTLRRIVADSGEARPVGALLAVLTVDAVSEEAVDQFIAEFRGATVSFEPQVEGTAAMADEPAQPVQAAAVTQDDDVRVSPHAKRLAERLGVDLSTICGTGRNGRITREDVEAAAAQRERAPQDSALPSTNVPTRTRLSGTRATIARRLLESKQNIPHYRLSADMQAAALVQRAAQLSQEASRRITVNDLLVRATALALVRHPQLNAWLEEDEVFAFPHPDVAIAVAAPAGLITPVVRGADGKSPAEISVLTSDLLERARQGELKREDITGGTFTLSNLGMFGVSRFDAIINPPQVAILAVGAAEERVIARGGTVVVAKMATLTLSADHRVIDGATGAAFLATLRQFIEEPAQL
jgi:pyruvate dehydrogenase E2 component (dihydrolipoamide acetyltransferase)